MYFQNEAFRVGVCVMVRESKHSDPLGSKVGGSSLVRGDPLRGCVLVAVQFNGQFQCGTVEVQIERPKWMLPTKFQPRDLASPDVLPDSGFGVRLIVT
jgi:hypothetical protein